MMVNKEFISNHDFNWPRLKYEGGYPKEGELVRGCRQVYPRGWNNGAFLGNGMIGAMIYKDTPQVLRWELGRSDVTAGNFMEGIDWATPRVPIGDMLLQAAGEILSESMHLHLWEAKATGFIKTSKGTISWSAKTLRTKDILVISLETTGEEKDCLLGFRPRHGVSPRIHFAQRNPHISELPPFPSQLRKRDVDLSIQKFLVKQGDDLVEQGECCVARKEEIINEDKRIYYIAITNAPQDFSAADQADNLVKDMNQEQLVKDEEKHCQWWQEYYQLSGIFLNDKVWETFYWRQVYKQACANREDGVVLDSQGPWLTDTTWPTTVWNLNVQLCYTPLYTSNRLALAKPLGNLLTKNINQLRDSALDAGFDRGILIYRATTPRDFSPHGYTFEAGNLTWALFCLWRNYLVTMDKTLLSETIFPLMKEHMEIFKQLFHEEEDGYWHIKETSSPEYPSRPDTNWTPIEDCNFTIALVRWLSQTLIKTNDLLDLKDKEKPYWQEVEKKLVPYAEDETGYRVGQDIPYSTSHRHYSHLFMIYPLHLLDNDSEEDRKKALTSIETWIGNKGRLQGYSFTGAANMAATLKMGDRALDYLNGLMEYVHPNTMYSESGPVIETPLSAMESIHYMLLQSWSGTIEVFPAMPESWENASFETLLADGAFEISARREKGVTKEVKVTSLAGEQGLIRPGIEGNQDCFEISLTAGESMIFNGENPQGEK